MERVSHVATRARCWRSKRLVPPQSLAFHPTLSWQAIMAPKLCIRDSDDDGDDTDSTANSVHQLEHLNVEALSTTGRKADGVAWRMPAIEHSSLSSESIAQSCFHIANALKLSRVQEHRRTMTARQLRSLASLIKAPTQVYYQSRNGKEHRIQSHSKQEQRVAMA
jgi:hypothetical protein